MPTADPASDPKPDRASGPAARIRVAVSPADLETVHAIRREVFIVEQNVPEDEEWDDLDAASVHLLAFGADGAPLGTGRLIHGEQALRQLSGERPPVPPRKPHVADVQRADTAPGHDGETVDRAGTVLLGRLAVLSVARGTGVGAALVRAIEDEGRARGAVELELHAQVHALGFYERLGYTAEGPEYLDGGIPHRTMTRSLAG
ncbi:GNAT family N-acetyltransferase [Streptacidiphilus carbonis]|uniref:GNAT family N-acetyltransferase n=1 Tax=Streptacidiphilus carbonis TaxID=105422 RepID=UPI0005A96385|nr:GNAT family N-acetyltransferase [Streptacidiphilus carbonis]